MASEAALDDPDRHLLHRWLGETTSSRRDVSVAAQLRVNAPKECGSARHPFLIDSASKSCTEIAVTQPARSILLLRLVLQYGTSLQHSWLNVGFRRGLSANDLATWSSGPSLTWSVIVSHVKADQLCVLVGLITG